MFKIGDIVKRKPKEFALVLRVNDLNLTVFWFYNDISKRRNYITDYDGFVQTEFKLLTTT